MDMRRLVGNMVFQVIGVMAVFSAKNEKTDNIVLTGNLTNVPMAKEIRDFLPEGGNILTFGETIFLPGVSIKHAHARAHTHTHPLGLCLPLTKPLLNTRSPRG